MINPPLITTHWATSCMCEIIHLSFLSSSRLHMKKLLIALTPFFRIDCSLFCLSRLSPLSYYPLSCYPTPCSLVLWCSSCYAGKRRDNGGGREKNRRGCLKTVKKSNFLKAWVKLVKLFENDVKVKFSKTLSVKMIEHFYFGCSR